MYTCSDSKDCSSANDQKFEKALERLKSIRDGLKGGSRLRGRLDKIITAYGEKNKGGPAIRFGERNLNGEKVILNGGNVHPRFSSNGEGKSVTYTQTVTFNLQTDELDVGVVGHEGQHVSDNADVMSATTWTRRGGFKTNEDLNLTYFQQEDRCLETQLELYRIVNPGASWIEPSGSREIPMYLESWEAVDISNASARPQFVQERMAVGRWRFLKEQYNVTLKNQGERFIKTKRR